MAAMPTVESKPAERGDVTGGSTDIYYFVGVAGSQVSLVAIVRNKTASFVQALYGQSRRPSIPHSGGYFLGRSVTTATKAPSSPH